ncbi:DUF6281 family protein [Streptomyces sp. RG80]|uniref:DUF6281 family protein n=1 Tax=Streptomyces sp. RG80 TaxID=3157340 RepID=UPI00338E6643
MTITRRALLATAAALLATTGCTVSGSGGEGHGSNSCAGVVTYDGRSYLPTEKSVFTVGERLGNATRKKCDDTPNHPGDTVPGSTTGAYAIEGVDPADGIAVGDTPAEAAPLAAR